MVTIQINSFQQYFHIILFALYVNPVKGNLFSSTFTWYYLFCKLCSPNFGGL